MSLEKENDLPESAYSGCTLKTDLTLGLPGATADVAKSAAKRGFAGTVDFKLGSCPDEDEASSVSTPPPSK